MEVMRDVFRSVDELCVRTKSVCWNSMRVWAVVCPSHDRVSCMRGLVYRTFPKIVIDVNFFRCFACAEGGATFCLWTLIGHSGRAIFQLSIVRIAL